MHIARPLFGYQAPSTELPKKEQTVAILGSSKVNPKTQPYLDTVQAISDRLSSMGYGILTGAGPGANYYGNLGARPDKSFVIHVNGWDSAENKRPDSQDPLYQDYARVDDGPTRTLMFNKLCNAAVVSPGGTGSLEEIGIMLEAMYYQTPDSPKQLILLGKNYWAPLVKMLQNMVDIGATNKRVLDLIHVIDVNPTNIIKAVDEAVNIMIKQQTPTDSRKLDLVG